MRIESNFKKIKMKKLLEFIYQVAYHKQKHKPQQKQTRINVIYQEMVIREEEGLKELKIILM